MENRKQETGNAHPANGRVRKREKIPGRWFLISCFVFSVFH